MADQRGSSAAEPNSQVGWRECLLEPPEVAAAPGPSGRGTPAGAAGPADAGSEGGGSSSSSRGVDWDEVEEREMRALDAKLDALCPCPGPAPSSARQATFQPPPRSAGAEAVAPKGPPKGPSAEQIQRLLESDAAVDFGALLTDVCKAEPYQPEDHEFTAEDMWGDSDDDAVAVRGNAALDAVVDRDNHHLTADEMWGGYSDGSDAGDANEAADGDIAALARAATVDVAVKAAESATQVMAQIYGGGGLNPSLTVQAPARSDQHLRSQKFMPWQKRTACLAPPIPSFQDRISDSLRPTPGNLVQGGAIAYENNGAGAMRSPSENLVTRNLVICVGCS